MGQKIHPIGFRLAVNKNWGSRWFTNSKNFATMLNEDLKVRDYLKGKLAHASVGRVVIERPAKDARITIHSARPGIVIGKKGEDIESLKTDLRKLLGVQMVHVNIEEIRKPEIDAQLIADSITQQLEKRIMFRRAMKRAMQNAMRLGAQGIKIMSAGRLNGIEIARTEWYREGRVPLHTLRADIDYGVSEAKTTYGIIGVKVWVYKGEVLAKADQPPAPMAPVVEDAPAAKTLKKAPSHTTVTLDAKNVGDVDTVRPIGTPRSRVVRKADDPGKNINEAAKTDVIGESIKSAVKRTKKPKTTPEGGSGEQSS